MKKYVAILVALILTAFGTFICIKYYEYVFAKTITGTIAQIERVNQNEAIIGGRNIPASQLYSFGVAIRDMKGEIHTASSEDRQWSVATPGQCVEAKFYPYAPWDLDKGGTYHNARLIRLFDCPGDKTPAPAPSS